MKSSSTAKLDKTRYYDYIRVGELTDLQRRKTKFHHETFFIIIHQVYELWFKAILTELDSVMEKFRDGEVPDEKTGEPTGIPEKEVAEIVLRLNRIAEIFKLLVAQVRVMETLTPLDFLDFRDKLTPASGYHSLQFRVMEVKFGLKLDQGRTEEFQQHHYLKATRNKYVRNRFAQDLRRKLVKANSSDSLFDHVNRWLARTPFIKTTRQGIWIENEEKKKNTPQKMRKLGSSDRDAIMGMREIFKRQPDKGRKQTPYEEFLEDIVKESGLDGRKELCHTAFLAALFIHLYRDEPILQQPHRLLESLKEIDELFCVWRDWHASMVMRMIGKKSGTAAYDPATRDGQQKSDKEGDKPVAGADSGVDVAENKKKEEVYGYRYLAGTRAYRLFPELDRVSTYMIPRAYLPEIPAHVMADMRRLLFRSRA